MDKKQKLVIARRYRKYIKDLQKQEDKFYQSALKELNIQQSNEYAYEFFYNDMEGKYRQAIIKGMFEAGNAKEV